MNRFPWLLVTFSIAGCAGTVNIIDPQISSQVSAQANTQISEPINSAPTPTPQIIYVQASESPALNSSPPSPNLETISIYRSDYFSFQFPSAVVQAMKDGKVLPDVFNATDSSYSVAVGTEVLVGSWLSHYDQIRNGAPGRPIKSGEIKVDGQPGYFAESITVINNRDKIYVEIAGTCLGRIIHVGLFADEDQSGELRGDALLNAVSSSWKWDLSAPAISSSIASTPFPSPDTPAACQGLINQARNAIAQKYERLKQQSMTDYAARGMAGSGQAASALRSLEDQQANEFLSAQTQIEATCK